MGTSPDGRRLYWKLAIALLAAAGVYAWYVTSQYGRLNDLNQRQLSNAAAELKWTIENAVGAVSRFNPQPTDRDAFCKFDLDQPYLAFVGDCAGRSGRLKGVEPTATAPLGIKAIDENGDMVTFTIRTDILLEELSFPESFGLIFIAGDTGLVLYHDTPAQRRWLRHLRWGEQRFRDSGANRYGSVQIQNLNDVFGGDKESGWSRLRSMSGRTTLRLGGDFHEVYLEPLVLENGEKVGLVLGGAVPTDAIIRQALAVDSHFLAGLVFLLLLGILGYPFVKLTSLDPRERFRLRDVMLLYVSTAALLALFTFAAQGLDGYVRWHGVADDGLEGLARKFDKDFNSEVGQIRDELMAFDTIVSQQAPESCEAWPIETDWFRQEAGKDQRRTLTPPDDGIHIEQVAWIGPAGKQVWKSTSDGGGSKVDVAARVYFRAVRDDSLFQLSGDDEPFYVGPDRSITDGTFYTFVSVRSRMPAGFCSDQPHEGGYVAVATTRLQSLDAPPLPAGYGFALINREGRVLYHSDPRLSLRENFFEELRDGARARAMVYAGHEAGVSSRYRERPHELYFHSLSIRRAHEGGASGLYLVTFRDTSVERSIVARVFVISLIGPLLLLIGFIGLSLWAASLAPRWWHDRWSGWLWPHGGLVRLYKVQTAVLLAVLATGMVCCALGASDIVFVIMPLVAMASAVGLYASGTQRRPDRCRLTSPGWYTAMFVMLLICVIVAPASALFRIALGHEFGKLIATEREWIEAQRRDMPQVVKADVRAENHPAAMGESLARARDGYLRETSDTTPYPPRPFGAVPAQTATAASWLLAPFHWMDDVLPIENDGAARERYEDQEYSYSPDGTWVPQWRVSGWGLLGVALTCGLLVWWTRWNTARLFFADLESRELDPASFDTLWTECSTHERLVLIRVVREHVANPYQRSAIAGLLQRGLLKLDPDLRPCSPAFGDYILGKEKEMQTELREWEEVDAGHSWRYTRLVLFASLGGLAFFLVATQPGLQSGLLGIATGITGALTASLKLRDALVSWIGDRKTTA